MLKVKVYPIIFILFFVLSPGGQSVLSQTPFPCEGQRFLILEDTYELVELDINPSNNAVKFNVIRDLGININALGFRNTDNLLYGINQSNNHLHRIDANGLVEDLGALSIPTNLFYRAGDIGPDGKYLITIGSDVNGFDQMLIKINLESANFLTESIPLSNGTRLADIVIDPSTNIFYGYDINNRRINSFNLNTNTLTSYQEIGREHEIKSLFFDAFGDLSAFGSTIFGVISALFSIDTTNGKEKLVTTGGPQPVTDGASCPYSIEIKNKVQPNNTLPCTETIYTYYIANGSKATQTGIGFEHQLPTSFRFIQTLRNPYGDINYSMELNTLSIENMSIARGVDSIKISVEIGDLPDGKYPSQAILNNLARNLGNISLSDDPSTVKVEDSTIVQLKRIEEDSLFFNNFLCIGESLILDASEFGNNLLWDDGSTQAEKTISEQGVYTLEILTGCKNTFVQYDVVSATCPFTIEIAHEILPDTIFPCSEVIYRFIIENDSGIAQKKHWISRFSSHRGKFFIHFKESLWRGSGA